MSQQNVDAARRMFEAWNRGDVDAWLQSFHPEIEWFSEVAGRLEGDATVYRGRDQMRRFWEEWRTVWETTIEISELRDLGGNGVALGRVLTHGSGSGVDLEIPVAYVAEFEDGLVRKARAYLDQNKALEAVGLSE
jgi:ketosteroid isomerase-like protein